MTARKVRANGQEADSIKNARVLLRRFDSVLTAKGNQIMTTRKELQEWLSRFPEDTIIEFSIQQEPQPWQSHGRIEFQSPTLADTDDGDGWEFMDFRNKKVVTPNEPHFGKCYLRLGEGS